MAEDLLALPKAELHCHLEGAVAPALALTLAARHGLDLSAVIDPQGRYIWRDFQEFLTVYDAMSEAIRTPEDYYDALYQYYRQAAGEGLIYGEMFFSPAHAARQGISYPTFVSALAAALDDVERDHGIIARLILTCVRHFGVEGAEATARLAARHPHPLVVGFGMAGDETFQTPRAFSKAFSIAAGSGLRLTAHAGELAGPESVKGALMDLGVERIGHGVRAIEAPGLLEDIRDRGVTLEICPSSNVSLGLYPSIAAHPIGRLAAMGVSTTLGSDDPPFFFTSIGLEYSRVAAAHAMSPAQMEGFTRRAIEAAFCDDATKAELRARLTARTP